MIKKFFNFILLIICNFSLVISPALAFDDFSDAVNNSLGDNSSKKENESNSFNNKKSIATQKNKNLNFNLTKKQDTTNYISKKSLNIPQNTSSNKKQDKSLSISYEEAFTQINSVVNNASQATNLLNAIGTKNISSFANNIGGLQNIGNLINATGNITQLTNTISSIGGGNFTNIISSLGSINNFSSFLNSINGIQNIQSFMNIIGGCSNFGNFLNTLGGFSNFGNFMNLIGGFGNMGNFMSMLGNFSNFGNLMNMLGNFGNFQSLLGMLGGLSNFQSLLGMLGGLSNFQSLLGMLGGLSNFQSLLGMLGGLSNLQSLLGILGNLGNLQGFLDLIGGMGNLSDIINSLGGIQELLNFIQWLTRLLHSFGVQFGSIKGTCNESSESGSSACAAVSNMQELLKKFKGEVGSSSSSSTSQSSVNVSSGGVNTEEDSDEENSNSKKKSFVNTNFQVNLKAKTFNKDASSSSNSDDNQQKQTFKKIIEEVQKYSNAGNDNKVTDESSAKLGYVKSKLPFEIGNEKASEILSKEYDEIKNNEIGMCNKSLNNDVKKISDLASGISTFHGGILGKSGNVTNNATDLQSNSLNYFKSSKATNKSLGTAMLGSLASLGSTMTNFTQSIVSSFLENGIDGVADALSGINPEKLPASTEKIPDGVTQCFIPTVETDGNFAHVALGWPICTEFHLSLKTKAVGHCQMTLTGKLAVPSRYRTRFLAPCCRLWTIWSDKIEYYYPVEKITLSDRPLYSRYLDQDTAKEMLQKFSSSVDDEIQNQSHSNNSASTLLEKVLQNTSSQNQESTTTKQNTNGNTTTNPNSNRKKQVKQDGDETIFLNQTQHGYGRIFPLEDAENSLTSTKWNNAKTNVLPHLTASKGYFGTDFDDKIQNQFSDNDNTDGKKSLSYFVNPAESYSKKDLFKKNEAHLENILNTLRRDSLVGGSRKYGTKQKADPNLHKQGVISDETFKEHNTYVTNKNAFGVGNVSSLHALTPTGNSDYILQTFMRTLNMFISEVKTLENKEFDESDEDKSKNMLTAIKAEDKACAGGDDDDTQLRKTYATVMTFGGTKSYAGMVADPAFYTTIAESGGNRQTYKAGYDVFHSPVIEEDNGENYPQSFNKFWNKDIQNIDESNGNGNANEAKGNKCYNASYMLNNNLDFNLMNTILKENENTKTVGNHGEISFTQYNLFTGTVGFPGQSCEFWYKGINLLSGGTFDPKVGFCTSDSKATPKFAPDEFRLF